MTDIILQGDALAVLKTLPDKSVNCCVTSPPYWGLRDYGHTDQLGMEKTPDLYVQHLVEVFKEVKRVLKDDGTCWLNLGDTYSAHKDCKSVPDTLRVGGRSEEANVIEKGKSNSRNSKLLKSVGLKNKDLIGIPWMVAFALRADGWYLRQDIIWSKPNPMPESVTDRCTKAHEYIFLLSKSQKYYYDQESIYEKATGNDPIRGPEKNGKKVLLNRDNGGFATKGYRAKRKNDNTTNGGNGKGFQDHSGYSNLENPYIRNKRSVWEVNTKPFAEAHFATFPEKLIVDMIKAGCPEGGVVIDPFIGAGTTGLVAKKLGRHYIGIELNPAYIKIAENRIFNEIGLFA